MRRDVFTCSDARLRCSIGCANETTRSVVFFLPRKFRIAYTPRAAQNLHWLCRIPLTARKESPCIPFKRVPRSSTIRRQRHRHTSSKTTGSYKANTRAAFPRSRCDCCCQVRWCSQSSAAWRSASACIRITTPPKTRRPHRRKIAACQWGQPRWQTATSPRPLLRRR